MNGRVMVLCASRDRNFACQRMIDSVQRTSSQADVAIYVDDDQAKDYGDIHGAAVSVGPRVGPVASLNALWQEHPGYDAYGAATDDCEFITPGWDQWILETTAKFPGAVGLISPRWSNRMDFPFATGNWTRALGWFAYPEAYHYYWDVLLEVMGAQTQSIVYATREQFAMTHDGTPGEDVRRKVRKDTFAVLRGIGFEVPMLVEKIRAAQA